MRRSQLPCKASISQFGWCSLFYLLLLMAFPNWLSAQENGPRRPTDVQTWTGIHASFWLHKDWNLDASVQSRQDGNGFRFRQVLLEGELGYEWGKKTEISTEYRWSGRLDENRHRVAMGISREVFDEGDWTLDARFKIQQEWSRFDPAELNGRWKAKVRYRINKRFRLFADAEAWTLSYPYWQAVDQVRFSFGTGWDRKKHDIELAYRHGRVTGNRTPRTEHILALEYTFGDFKLRSRK